MKLVIDIDEKDYKDFQLQAVMLNPTEPSQRAKLAIANGTPYDERKTGKWTFCGYETERDWILGIKSFKCSVCDKKGDWKSPYCPNCGVKMEVEE